MVLVVGGGASGLIAAIAAGRVLGGGNIKIFEKNDRIGRKILSTGNGRCNLTNINASPDDYIGEDPRFVSYALKQFGPGQVIDFFNRLGLLVKTEDNGRVYPKCSLAGAVLDTLRNEIARLSIEVIHTEVTDISFDHASFGIYDSTGKATRGQKVIIAAGGCAAPFLGSDGSGYKLLAKLGHKINAVYPVLVQIRTNFPDIKTLNGIRAYAGLKIMNNGSVISYQECEIQFTNYGISGIPALNLSCMAGQGSDMVIDFSPDTDNEDLLRLLEKRAAGLSYLGADQFFTGFFHKSIARLLLIQAGVQYSMPVSQFTKKEFIKLTGAIKSFPMPLSGVLGFNEAQATGGGIQTAGFNPYTMESRLRKGLYAAGEILDIYGPCGGYNLQWAWASGYLAGISAASH